MEWEELKGKWGKKTDNKKWIIGLVVIAIVITGYFLLPKEKITIEETEKITSFEGFEIKPTSGETYRIIYESGKFNSTCILQKMVFPDNTQTSSFLEEFTTKFSNFTSDKTSLTIDSFNGYEFVTLSPSTKSPSGYGLTVKKDNNFIFGSCFDKSSIEEVTKWFIKKFY